MTDCTDAIITETQTQIVTVEETIVETVEVQTSPNPSTVIVNTDGSVIIEQTETEVIEITSDSVIHNNLNGLQGGAENEFYHLTASEYTIVQNTSGINTGDVTVNNVGNDVTLSLSSQILSANLTSTAISQFTNDSGYITGVAWGDITGTISDQTDLQAEIDALVPYSGATQDVNLGSNTIFINDNDVYVELVHARGTGLDSGGVISINASGNTLDYTGGDAYFVNNYTDPEDPTLLRVTFSGATGVALTNLATANQTYLAINASGDLVQQTTAFTPDQFRDLAILGIARHYDRVNIDTVFPLTALAYDTAAQLSDVMLALGVINTAGNVFSAASTNLTLSRSAGQLFREGSNYENTVATRKNPNFVTTVAETPVTFRYLFRNGTGGISQEADTINVDPANYDDGSGTLASVPSAKWTIQPIYFISNSDDLTRLMYGQKLYNNSDEAEVGITADASTRIVDPDLAANFSLRGYLLLKGNATDLSNTDQAKFVPVDKFGSTDTGGAGGVTDHNLLAGLQGGTTNEYFHATAAEYTVLQATSGVNTGDQTTSGTPNRITVANGTTNPIINIATDYAGQSTITTLGTVTTGTWQASEITTSFTTAKVESVTGTADQITVTGIVNDPVISIASTYAGQASINTVGTITTGTWSGLFGAVSGANLTNLTPGNISAGTAGIDITGNAATVTTNANLTGVITSIGNATSIASQTGTGTKFVVDTSPTLITPNIGVATATSINKVTITQPATGATITLADGATLTVSSNATVSGTNTGDQDLSGLVPYTGATQDVDLGSFRLDTTGNISAADPILAQDVVTKQYLEDNQYITETQSFTSQTSVTVTHNNGYFTHPIAVISNDEYIPFTVTQTSINAFTVTFSSAQTGFLFYPTSGVSSASLAEPPYVIVSANYTILTDDYFVEADTAGITLTLPTAVGVTGKQYNLYNSSGGLCFVANLLGGTENFYDSETIGVVSNGTIWRIT